MVVAPLNLEVGIAEKSNENLYMKAHVHLSKQYSGTSRLVHFEGLPSFFEYSPLTNFIGRNQLEKKPLL